MAKAVKRLPEQAVFRKELIQWLCRRPFTVSELAQLFQCRPRDIEADLHHLQRTLRRQGRRLHIDPARCRHCGFLFRDKLRKPGKCPRCRRTWIEEPRVWIE
ncbi:MAG TPA: transcriptional regulator [Methylothermaceae bacterium]|nr:transcriptional regulator [Methylothermaceae bacterium]